MHAKCSLRKMHLEVGGKNVTRPGPIIKYLLGVLDEIHKSFNMKYGKVHVIKGWVHLFIKIDGTCLMNKLLLTTVYKPCQCKKYYILYCILYRILFARHFIYLCFVLLKNLFPVTCYLSY